MSTALPDVVDISEQLNRASSPAEVWQVVKAALTPLGYEHVCVLAHQPELRERIAPAVLYCDAPQGFADKLDRVSDGIDNPLIQRALTRLEPLAASEIWAQPLSSRQRRVLAYIGATLKMRDGFTIPVRLNEALDGIVLFGGRKPDVSALSRSLLHLIAHAAFKRGRELTEAPKRRTKGGLTARELECLRWTAVGKTDAEIGVILAISARTARFHIENAKRKLGVSTRIQAVAEALKQRAIAA